MVTEVKKKLVEGTSLRFVGKYTTSEMTKRAFNIPMRRINASLLPLRTISMPHVIQLEPTNKCNLKCGMCHRSILLPSKIGEMTFAHFRKIVDPLLPYLEAVWLQGEGEPFLCKDILEMIRYLKSKGIYVNTVTNATLLKKDLCADILSSGLDEIAFSIDGATAETYEQIRVGASFAEVTKNIRTFTSLAEDSSRKNLKICGFVVAMKENLQELADIVTLIHNLGIKYLWVQDVQFQQLDAGLATKKESLRARSEENNLEKEQINRIVMAAWKLASKYDIQILRYGGKSIFDRLTISHTRQKCSWPWTSAYITWDGFVSPCCIPNNYFCGNLLQEPFKKIWNNKKYHHFRNRLKSGRLPYQCINCSFL
jgi:radical SAM protein with 4Fe4S-binding SPASM domain